MRLDIALSCSLVAVFVSGAGCDSKMVEASSDLAVGVDAAAPDIATTHDAGPAIYIAHSNVPDGFMANWGGDCCGLTCKQDQLCVSESDGMSFCMSLPDGGLCAQPGICGTSCQGGIAGCPLGLHARCVDFPPSCATNPTCGCVVPLVEADGSGNCHQHCDDSMLISSGRIRCVGL